MMRLLYAEDEVSMSEAVTEILTYHKYTVDAVYDGEEALQYAMTDNYDGIILDIMMPKLNGIEVLSRLRDSGCKTPILLLTAKSAVDDRIKGLNMGADDYLSKPFVMGELLARIRAMLRRREDFTPDIVRCGNVYLNMQSFELGTDAQSFTLPKIEYKIMELLMLNKGIYVSAEDMLIKVWGYDTDADTNNVWVYISYLRKRLVALNATVEIKAKRDVGYTLEVIE